jgi:hypothetical protein
VSLRALYFQKLFLKTDYDHKEQQLTCSFWRVVTMVYNTRNFSVSGLYPSSCVWRNTTFRKLDLFPSSGKKGGGRHLLSWVP